MKFFISCLIFIFSTGVNSASESTSALLEESDFQALSAELKKKSLGLVLMFHAEHCPYCALMENEILSPMIKSGEYTNKVIIRKLQIDEARDIKDFDGSVIEPSDISDRYNTVVTPTLVFLDYSGKEKAKAMVGINTVDYFGVYLDEEIEKLRANIKTELAKNTKTNSSAAAN